ncbi:alcohol dehydrogenase GroES domain-containing protein [Xylaria cubensis]|nr:alcohol dehydrogenase GroES domain-containing protein [Xylaria cubensis]
MFSLKNHKLLATFKRLLFNSFLKLLKNGNPRGYAIIFPLVGGLHAIGQVATVLADATTLKVGDLVAAEPLIRAQDNINFKVLLAIYYSFIVPYRGFREANLIARKIILIVPVTGNFSGAAVYVALAIGAYVIAIGYNEKILSKLKDLAPERIKIVKISRTAKANITALAKFSKVDIFLNLMPLTATNTEHINIGILLVKPKGKVSLIGGINDIVLIRAYINISKQAKDLIKLIERGILKFKNGVKALKLASKKGGAGRAVFFFLN